VRYYHAARSPRGQKKRVQRLAPFDRHPLTRSPATTPSRRAAETSVAGRARSRTPGPSAFAARRTRSPPGRRPPRRLQGRHPAQPTV